MKPMKRLSFDGQSHFKRDSKECISAVAWATMRRARVSWKSDNVNATIREYLAREADYIMDPADVAYVMHWLVDNGYAWRKDDAPGKRVVEFGFHQDVDLTGHPKPKPGVTSRIARLRAEAEAVGMTVQPATEPEEGVKHFPEDVSDVPLPGEPPPPPPPYRLDELVKLLTDWADSDPDKYATYVDAAIERLT